MSEKMQLISAKICPFVQRTVILLNEKQAEFEVTYINLNDKPDWFNAISPLGIVPVLKVGEKVLFESAVIQEYVDDVTPPSLHPADPLLKAQNRSWIPFGRDLTMDSYYLTQKKSADEFEALKNSMIERLTRLEAVHSGEDCFNGNEFSVIDAAYAPLFMRLALTEEMAGVLFFTGLPKLQHWSNHLLGLSAVRESVVPEFYELYEKMVCGVEGGYLAS